MKYIFPACFYKEDESDAYAVVVPDLPCCVSGGENITEAERMGIDAAAGWIYSQIEDGYKIPQASKAVSIVPDEDGFVKLLTIDLDAFADEYGYEHIGTVAPMLAVG